jgi:3-hydroxyisobutyrate dehydrogenase
MTRLPEDVGFVGLGLMGREMAAHLLQAGCALHVHSRTRAKAEALCAQGARWHDSPASLSSACSAIITMVGVPSEVEAVHAELRVTAREGALLIDMSTSSPALAERMHAQGEERGLRVLDAPVSGGVRGARNATLSIMAGGSEADFEAALPLLRKLGSKIVWCGPAGHGQRTKLVNQTVVAMTLLGAIEGVSLARKAGLDRAKLLDVLGSGTAASTLLGVYGATPFTEDYAATFSVNHFIKDMGLALAEARSLGLDLCGLAAALAQFQRLAREFGGEEGIQSIARLYR